MDNKIEPYKDIALIYEEIRPSYPEELINDILKITNLNYKDKILEIGAGTGKATVQFADKGYKIDAIEIGKDMGEVLINKCKKYDSNVSIEITSFEEWNPQNTTKYDVIYCAQAFHWLDNNVKYNKCYNLLKDNGFLILFWYNASEEKTEKTKIINQRVNETINKYVDNYYDNKKQIERKNHSGIYEEDERKAEIEGTQLFEIVNKIDYRTEIKNTPKQYLNAKKSVPAFASILDGMDSGIINNMEKEIEDIINDNGGYVGTLFDYSLYIAKKK
ncbi:class I SAM-dependent methyltransferase [Vallitalea guaymasensis]|uniref:class I SAM-dependent methyltransferase n=1 Tax=Vallitalea guaymasensis TaxID=1185412 RepID=UPI000DE2A91F|nr:class I SAM-dependent methyltransferase [Vallitalea guaymasensis]